MPVVLFACHSERRHWSIQLRIFLLPLRGCLAAAAGADVAADELFALTADELRFLRLRRRRGLGAVGGERS
jgi:hypothetical protein